MGSNWQMDDTNLLGSLYQIGSEHPGPASLLTLFFSICGWIAGIITHRRSVERQLATSRQTVSDLREAMISLLASLEAGATPAQLQVQAALARRTLTEKP